MNQPLYSFSPETLRRLKLMGPWVFNLTESTIVSIPALTALRILNFLYPIQTQVTFPSLQSSLGASFAELIDLSFSFFLFLWPFILPVTLFLVANAAGWASLRREDSSASARRRATTAYLYFEGAHAMIPEALSTAGFVSVIYLQIVSLKIPHDTSVAWFAAPSSLIVLVGTFWANYVVGGVVPKKLFALNGYSRKTFHYMREFDELPYGPWNKYNATILWVSPTIAIILISLGASICFAAALAVTYLRHLAVAQ